ncbi:unnamed protein product [Protopolystoma xenopodis]|uniref:Uncharacterized protein n=1 Tax=Protopolystoma xenopodis TaxID=117903 RepID=A0A448XN66_9PLAT|nr:unnamed protein product [Protopolystoma xenopodis]
MTSLGLKRHRLTLLPFPAVRVLHTDLVYTPSPPTHLPPIGPQECVWKCSLVQSAIIAYKNSCHKPMTGGLDDLFIQCVKQKFIQNADPRTGIHVRADQLASTAHDIIGIRSRRHSRTLSDQAKTGVWRRRC